MDEHLHLKAENWSKNDPFFKLVKIQIYSKCCPCDMLADAVKVAGLETSEDNTCYTNQDARTKNSRISKNDVCWNL